MTTAADRKDPFIYKVARAPIMLFDVLVGLISLILVAAIATSGQIWEELLKSIGVKFEKQWPLIVLGLITYFLCFLYLPIVVGNMALGWPGAVLMPLVIIGLMAILNKW